MIDNEVSGLNGYGKKKTILVQAIEGKKGPPQCIMNL